MAKQPLNKQDTVVRYVGKQKQNLDANGNSLGPHWSAFDLKDGEKYLSIHSREKAADNVERQMPIIKAELAKSKLSGKSAILTSGTVSDIEESFEPAVVNLNCFNNKDKPSYSGLENMPTVNRKLYLKALEKEHWNDWVKLSDI